MKPLSVDHFACETYAPEKLLDYIGGLTGLANDAAIARYLHVSAPVISKMRNRRLPVSDAILVRIHEITELPIARLKELAGIPPAAFDMVVQSMDGRNTRWSRRQARGLTL